MAVRRIDLFAVQVHFTLADYASSAAFAAKISSLFEQIDGLRERDRNGRYRFPALAVFPEDIGTFLLITPYYKQIRDADTVEEAMRRIARRRLPGVVWHRARYHASTLRALLLMTARASYETYYRTFSTLARRHQLPVVAGSLLVPDNRYGSTATFRLSPPPTRVYNLGLTFDARGEVIHSVKKVNLVRGVEDALELTPGTVQEQRPFEVCGARIGNTICYDGFLVGHEPAFVPVGPQLVSQGAEILTQPSANAAAWQAAWPFSGPGRSLTQADAWFEHGLLALMAEMPEVRYGINPMLNGRFFELGFEGQSAILGRGRDGRPEVLVLAEAFGDDPAAGQVLKVEAELPARARLRPPDVERAVPAGAPALS